MDLSVHPLKSDLERHPYGFDQPVAGSPLVPDSMVAVVLVPGLAFDAKGGRLGFGAGYYDRFLTRLIRANTPRTLCMVGVSTTGLVAEVPMESHDIYMTHLATTAGVVAAKR